MDHLPDWITAVSTAVTAIAAIAAGVVAYVAYRFQAKPALPVIEPDFGWKRTTYDGLILELRLVVRNQLYETIALEHIAIKSPSGMTFRERRLESDGTVNFVMDDTRYHYERTQKREIDLEWEIEPLGTTYPSYLSTMPKQRADVTQKNFYFAPPDGWKGGVVKIDLRFLSKALTIRPRKTVIKRTVPPHAAMTGGE